MGMSKLAAKAEGRTRLDSIEQKWPGLDRWMG